MYLDQPLQQYLDELAAAQPTPGGGSASALTGAIGASLASMVARLTLGKEKYADVQPEIEEILQQTEKLRQRFQQLMQEDIEAYGKLSVAFKLPHDTSEESQVRSTTIQAQLVEAALVPLEMAESASQLLQYCLRIAEIGNASVLSDIANAALLASSAGAGAAWMVRANLQFMKDTELVDSLSDRLSITLDDISERSQQIPAIVGNRA